MRSKTTVSSGTAASLYDDPLFFERYLEYRRCPYCYTDTVAWPALNTVVPDLRGRSVLDLGSGLGDFCLRAHAEGAIKIVGVDNSRRMQRHARRRSRGTNIQLELMPIEEFESPDAHFDLVISSMTLHYLRDLPQIFRRIFRWTKPRGILVFSMNHPTLTAVLGDDASPRWDGGGSRMLDHYFSEGPRPHNWLVPNVIKHHITMATLIKGLLDAGFRLDALLEPTAPTDLQEVYPDLRKTTRAPFCVVVKSTKPA